MVGASIQPVTMAMLVATVPCGVRHMTRPGVSATAPPGVARVSAA